MNKHVVFITNLHLMLLLLNLDAAIRIIPAFFVMKKQPDIKLKFGQQPSLIQTQFYAGYANNK